MLLGYFVLMSSVATTITVGITYKLITDFNAFDLMLIPIAFGFWAITYLFWKHL
jgi:hypothetical protein